MMIHSAAPGADRVKARRRPLVAGATSRRRPVQAARVGPTGNGRPRAVLSGLTPTRQARELAAYQWGADRRALERCDGLFEFQTGRRHCCWRLICSPATCLA